ncbi:acireductone dioxygenase [Sphaerisporangium siamense]|uniref:Acireductone dioxygenase n=1 Tax=Sphaerisporangium siamense TaxID=795645 RepID=A0A7W7GC06_9ACTN|nr:cupin [Sphaerisporangium siamense]MBB4704062.1 1,2-dihydroxy-3-keto-5-methylthiopentene dioxygenase [Sphaerisporangium siamense]GII82537.1 acireductone dioxygenase [Sphaerisporangium siamense]
MTHLTVYTDGETPRRLLETEDAGVITATLKEIDVRLRRWEVVGALTSGGTREEVLAAYRQEVARVVAEEGYAFVDVARLHPSDDPGWPEPARAAREKFLAEHTHDDDEVRFFAGGTGVFYLHVGGRVHAVLCEAGDLLSVPKNTTHWFDMGARPDFTAIRFFHDDDGWVGNFTGDPVSTRVPGHDAIVARRAAGKAR